MTSLALDREENIRRLQSDSFDIVIVGGGINGAGVARDAVQRGYSVALIERNDFASGTSSRSSQLIHGGLRYLELGEFALVFESVSERYWLAQIARHLVRPLPFVFPVFRADRYKVAVLAIGLWIYDCLALFRNHKNHVTLSKEETLTKIPALRELGLTGAVRYFDYQTNDARLVIENIVDAIQLGVVALPYCSAESFNYESGRITSVICTDQKTKRSFRVRGKSFVAATGPWIDELLHRTTQPDHWIRPAKGVHIVLPFKKVPISEAIAMRHPRDQRVLFALPFYEHTVIGTTDTDFTGSLDAIYAEADDVHYLIDAANAYFPATSITSADVIATWAGVRPLLFDHTAESPSSVSREHRVELRADGLIVVGGGKLTTYRRIAKLCVDTLAPFIDERGGSLLTSVHHALSTRALPGASGIRTEDDLERLRRSVAMRICDDRVVAHHLVSQYGVRALRILDLIEQDRTLGDRIATDFPFIWAEVVHAVRDEFATTLVDIFKRRMSLFFRLPDQGVSFIDNGVELIARELSLAAEEKRALKIDYLKEVADNRRWRNP